MSEQRSRGTRGTTATGWVAFLLVSACVGMLTACGDDDDGHHVEQSDAAITAGEDGAVAEDGGGSAEQDAALPVSPDHCDSDEDAGAGVCPEGKNCIGGTCVWNTCGDGIVAEDEECDDGNEATGDECNPDCKKVSPTCGDGLVQDGEECDDGNWFNADACSNSCTLNLCGNGRVELDEECDDGNNVDTDDCSNHCTENRCRNGRVDPGEECDDGNRDHHDGCTNACHIVLCGNGKPEEWEECDDGNQIDDDGCSNTCTKNECGNLRVDPGEACDGDSAGRQCSDDCKMVVENSQCTDCLKEKCDVDDYDFSGIGHMYTSCLNNTGDAAFGQLCQDFVNCAFASKCWVGGQATNFSLCYCGNASPVMCQSNMGVDGVCLQQWQAASQSTDFDQALIRYTEATTYPSGAGFWLLTCAHTECAAECGDTATGNAAP